MSKTLAISIGALAALLIGFVALLTAPAFGWSTAVDGSATCVDGKAVVTWKVTNSEKDHDLHVTASDNPAIPVGATVPGGQVGSFDQVVDKAGPVGVTITVGWDGSNETANGSKTVTVDDDCKPTEPEPTPTPTPTNPPTTAPPTPTPPVTTPTPTNPAPVPPVVAPPTTTPDNPPADVPDTGK